MNATRIHRLSTPQLLAAAALAVAVAIALLIASATAASASSIVPQAAAAGKTNGSAPGTSVGAIYLVVMVVGAGVAFTGRKVRIRRFA